MSHRDHALRALILVNPKEAKERILSAIQKKKGHQGDAAKHLGCSHGTLIRWIAALDMSKDIDALIAKMKKEGTFHEKNSRGGFTADRRRKKKRTETRIHPG